MDRGEPCHAVPLDPQLEVRIGLYFGDDSDLYRDGLKVAALPNFHSLYLLL